MPHDINAHVFSIMARMAIQPSPANYELIHEIVTGNNPALRRRFLQLGRNPSRQALEKLAEEFLPHHFAEALGDRSVETIRGELEQMIGSFQSVQQELDSYSQALTAAQQGIEAAGGDAAAVRSRIGDLASATLRQRENTGSAAAALRQRLAAIVSVSQELDEARKVKFTHPATGLHNRRSWNKRLAEHMAADRMPPGLSVVAARIGNLDVFEKANLGKVRAHILARIGAIVRRLCPDAFAAWLETPSFAVLLDDGGAAEIERRTAGLKAALQPVFDDVHKRLPNFLPLTLAFGACEAHSAFSLTGMVENAQKALANAEKLGNGSLVLFGVTEKPEMQRHNYALYETTGKHALVL